MMRTARYFAWGLLLSPLVLVLLGIIVTYLPPVAAILQTTVWGFLSQLPIFSLASAILESFVKTAQFSQDSFIMGFKQLLVNALADAMTIACCIFLLKSLCTFFNRKWHGRFTKPVWLITLGGVFLGVIVSVIRETQGAAINSLIFLLVCIGCVVGGMVILLRGTWFTPGGTYSNRWGAFVIRMLLGIVGDVFDALCGVFIATAVVRCPQLVAAGGNLKTCLMWIAASAIALFLKNLVMDLFAPNP